MIRTMSRVFRPAWPLLILVLSGSTTAPAAAGQAGNQRNPRGTFFEK
jgi:hypothetical protein